MSKPWQFKRQQVILAHGDDGDDHDAASVCSEVSDFDPSQISDPTLQQQALQSQQDLRSGATARKHSLQTIALIDAMWKNWQLWAVSASLGDPVRLLRKGAKNSAVFMAFLQFYHDKHKVGRAESYKNYWKRVKQVYVREVQTDLPTTISGEISNWFLNTFYSRNDVQRKRRDRQVLDHRSLFAALHYLWTFDTTVYTIERNRIQLVTMLLWLAYTGVRPGSLILSTSKKDCDAEYTLGKRAIRYEDVSLYLLRTPSCDPVLAMQIRIIQQKGEQERSAPPSVFSFFENRSCPVMCPILPFLALAFADRAFHPTFLEAGLGPQNIYSFSARYGSERMKVDWNEQMLKTPIFWAKRHGLNGAEVDPHNPINTGNISQWFGSLCEQAGFEKGLCPYTIRRGVGTKLTDQGIASERRNQIMGHSRSSIFEQWYQDHKIAVDVQAAFLEESSRPELMASLTRQCLRLDPDLPRSLTDKQRAEAHATPKIRKLQAEVDKLGLQLSNDWGSVAKGRDREPEKASRRDKLQNEIKSLKETSSRNFLKKLQTDFHSQADLSAMVQQLEGNGTSKRFLAKPIYTLHERQTLSEMLVRENTDDAAFASIVRCMNAISTRREMRPRKSSANKSSFNDWEDPVQPETDSTSSSAPPKSATERLLDRADCLEADSMEGNTAVRKTHGIAAALHVGPVNTEPLSVSEKSHELLSTREVGNTERSRSLAAAQATRKASAFATKLKSTCYKEATHLSLLRRSVQVCNHKQPHQALSMESLQVCHRRILLSQGGLSQSHPPPRCLLPPRFESSWGRYGQTGLLGRDQDWPWR